MGNCCGNVKPDRAEDTASERSSDSGARNVLKPFVPLGASSRQQLAPALRDNDRGASVLDRKWTLTTSQVHDAAPKAE